MQVLGDITPGDVPVKIAKCYTKEHLDDEDKGNYKTRFINELNGTLNTRVQQVY